MINNELLALPLEMLVLSTGAQLLYLLQRQLHSWDTWHQSPFSLGRRLLSWV